MIVYTNSMLERPDPLRPLPTIPPDSRPRHPLATLTLRWFTRLVALIVGVTLLVLLFASRELPNGTEWLGVVFFPIGVALGMLLGLWRELLGGVLALFSLVTFYLVFILVGQSLPQGPYFAILSLPALLQIITGLLARRTRR